MGLLRNIGQLAPCGEGDGAGDVGLLSEAAIAWAGERIVWTGREADLPASLREDEEVFDAGGRLVVPGLVDCHTHLAFGGWRADEFEQRCRGASYLEIAEQGGGILSTVHHTRHTPEEELFQKAVGFLEEMTRLGVTTVECKSGYGLTTGDELKLLRVYRLLARERPTRIVSTFLGAHTVPVEFQGRRGAYVDLVCEEMIPAVADEQLASFCDVFVETSAFSVDEGRRVLTTGLKHGLRPKVHADQLSTSGGGELAASLNAASADHLEYVSDVAVAAMAEAGVTAVSLPLASMYLGQKPLDGRRLIEAGVRVAVATDFNPGSAPSYHLPLALTLACTMNGLTPGEALKAGTLHAAAAIDRAHEVGSIEAGKKADFIVVDADSVNQWLYHFRPNAVVATFLGGQIIESGSLSSG